MIQYKNIILIGMPGCGKSAVGRALARRLGKEFLDLDRLIEADAGKPIPRIFAEEGGGRFPRAGKRRRPKGRGPYRLYPQYRRRCGDTPGKLCSPSSKRRYRPPDPFSGKLPTAGRPVSQSTDLRELWRRREPLYQSFADLMADNNGSIEDTVRTVLKEVNGR